MKFKKIVSLFSLIFITTGLYSKDLSDTTILEMHQDVLSEYSKMRTEQKLHDHIALQGLFKKAAEADSKYLRKLEKDITKLRKTIRTKKKNQETIDKDSALFEKLETLYQFLKKYRLQIDIMTFHALIKKDWDDIMQAVDKGEDILPRLPSKGITKGGIKGLKIFINKINGALRKAEEYETRLHTDWIDLKLVNYVLKIELIRLRNAGIFHPMYRGTPIVTSYPR